MNKHRDGVNAGMQGRIGGRRRVLRRLCVGACVSAVAVVMAPATSGAAAPRALRLVSAGPSGELPAPYLGASTDGSRVYFRTSAALLSKDVDTAEDVYERDADGSLHLISTGDSGNLDVEFRRASSDGSRVFLQTSARLLPTEDGDTAPDIYERDADGSLHLISTGDSGSLGVDFQGASEDGSRVFFQTTAPLLQADADTLFDVYEHDADGSLHLISTDQAGSGRSDSVGAFFSSASTDGSRVFMLTQAALLNEDDDTAQDVYEHDADGSLHLVSIGNSGAVGVFLSGTSADGSRVFISTLARLLPNEDTDAAIDVYEHDADGSLHLVSTGPSGDVEVGFARASADGSRVFLGTTAPLLREDDDTAFDVYEHDADSSLHLISSTPSGDADVFIRGASADGSRTFLQTTAALLGEDHDTAVDVYEHDLDGSLHLVSTGTSGDLPVAFRGASTDGSRVFIETIAPLLREDRDNGLDVYEHDADGSLHLVSIGNSGDGFVFFTGASADGSHVFFQTTAPLLSEDADSAFDVYELS